jgi:ParB/RepB/Spo0J family partition protein
MSKTKTKHVETEPEDQLIPFGQLRLGPNPRAPTKEAVKAMAASIKGVGLINPLLVCPAEEAEGCYEVRAGGTRYAALLELGVAPETEIRCAVLERGSALHGARAIAENVIRTPLSPLQEADAFAALAAEGHSRRAIAQMYGMTDRLVGQRLQLANLSPSWRERAASKGNLNLDVAARLASRPAAEQEAVHEACVAAKRFEDWAIKRYLDDKAIDASVALFDLAEHGIAVIEDLFVPAGQPGARTVQDRARFLELQRATARQRLEEGAAAIGAVWTFWHDESEPREGGHTYFQEPGQWIRSRPLPWAPPQGTEAQRQAELEEPDEYDDPDAGDEDDEEEVQPVATVVDPPGIERGLGVRIQSDGKVHFLQRGREKPKTDEEKAAAKAEQRTSAVPGKLSQTQEAVIDEVHALIAAGHVLADRDTALRVAIVQLAKAGTRSYDRHLGNIVAEHPSLLADALRRGWTWLARAARGRYDEDSAEKRSGRSAKALHGELDAHLLYQALLPLSRERLLEVLAHATCLAMDAGNPWGSYGSGGRDERRASIPNLLRAWAGSERDGEEYRMGPYELGKFTSDQLAGQIEGSGLGVKPGKTRKATIEAGRQEQIAGGAATVFPVFAGAPQVALDELEGDAGEDEEEEAA